MIKVASRARGPDHFKNMKMSTFDTFSWGNAVLSYEKCLFRTFGCKSGVFLHKTVSLRVSALEVKVAIYPNNPEVKSGIYP